MKKGIVLLLLISSVVVNAQSLKEALYGGKLKNKPGEVIRKDDDLSKMIDTTTRKVSPNDSLPSTTSPMTLEDMSRWANAPDTATRKIAGNTGNPADSTGQSAPVASGENRAEPKDNETLLSDYFNAVITALQTEVLSSKKIKKGTYYVSVPYTIDTDGMFTANKILLTPENDYLHEQIKNRLLFDIPRFTPALSPSGQPRSVNRNYTFTLDKE